VRDLADAVLKALVHVEHHQHAGQIPLEDLDAEMKKCASALRPDELRVRSFRLLSGAGRSIATAVSHLVRANGIAEQQADAATDRSAARETALEMLWAARGDYEAGIAALDNAE